MSREKFRRRQFHDLLPSVRPSAAPPARLDGVVGRWTVARARPPAARPHLACAERGPLLFVIFQRAQPGRTDRQTDRGNHPEWGIDESTPRQFKWKYSPGAVDMDQQ